MHTAHDAASQDHSQPQPTHPYRTPHVVGHGLILLVMGIMMPETCWDRKFDNKHRISCILLVFSFHLLLFIEFPSVWLNNLTFINRRHSLFKIFIMLPFCRNLVSAPLERLYYPSTLATPLVHSLRSRVCLWKPYACVYGTERARCSSIG